MGAWGGGLYDGDFARDLKGTIDAVLRAPLSDDEVLAEIWAAQGAGAGDIDALDYWLVLADQLERRGIRRADVFTRALAIVAAGEDVAQLQALKANATSIARRRKATADLVMRLRDPRPAKKRRPLKQPQTLLLQPGEALTWPTDKGNSINPYVAEHLLWKLGGFTRDGWGFGIVTDAGHQFHVLAWYAVQVLKWRRPAKPSPELAVHCPRVAPHYGTLTELHFRRARIERLGHVPDAALEPKASPAMVAREARHAVLRDIGLTGALGVDAWNTWVLPGPKFVYPAPSGTPLDPNEPDQRPPPPDAP